MLGSFVDLATALGQKVASAFITKQGVQTPRQRAVSTSGDSFDFGAGVSKLLQPVSNLFGGPKSGVQILEGAQGVGNEVFNALGRNVGSAIDKLFGNGNKMPSAGVREETNIVRASDGFASQYLNLGEAFKLFSTIQQGRAGLNDPVQSIPQQNNSNLLIIGGFAALGIVLLMTARKA